MIRAKNWGPPRGGVIFGAGVTQSLSLAVSRAPRHPMSDPVIVRVEQDLPRGAPVPELHNTGVLLAFALVAAWTVRVCFLRARLAQCSAALGAGNVRCDCHHSFIRARCSPHTLPQVHELRRLHQHVNIVRALEVPHIQQLMRSQHSNQPDHVTNVALLAQLQDARTRFSCGPDAGSAAVASPLPCAHSGEPGGMLCLEVLALCPTLLCVAWGATEEEALILARAFAAAPSAAATAAAAAASPPDKPLAAAAEAAAAATPAPAVIWELPPDTPTPAARALQRALPGGLSLPPSLPRPARAASAGGASAAAPPSAAPRAHLLHRLSRSLHRLSRTLRRPSRRRVVSFSPPPPVDLDWSASSPTPPESPLPAPYLPVRQYSASPVPPAPPSPLLRAPGETACAVRLLRAELAAAVTVTVPDAAGAALAAGLLVEAEVGAGAGVAGVALPCELYRSIFVRTSRRARARAHRPPAPAFRPPRAAVCASDLRCTACNAARGPGGGQRRCCCCRARLRRACRGQRRR